MNILKRLRVRESPTEPECPLAQDEPDLKVKPCQDFQRSCLLRKWFTDQSSGLVRAWAQLRQWAARDPDAPKRRGLHDVVAQNLVLQVILGAGPTQLPGWLATDSDSLNVARRRDWQAIFGRRKIDALLAEHVWEHLTLPDARRANRNCFRFLRPGGRLRLAVPDGLHPDRSYREHVRPGGCGLGAEDHKVLYDYRLMSNLLQEAGFQVKLLEYWDESGQFHFVNWISEEGHIVRSRRYDPRNQDGSLSYTSLIVDALKP